ncbi:hypothetical protein P9112_013003 [Eukaryota sp. TZLM1-RC]
MTSRLLYTSDTKPPRGTGPSSFKTTTKLAQTVKLPAKRTKAKTTFTPTPHLSQSKPRTHSQPPKPLSVTSLPSTGFIGDCRSHSSTVPGERVAQHRNRQKIVYDEVIEGFRFEFKDIHQKFKDFLISKTRGFDSWFDSVIKTINGQLKSNDFHNGKASIKEIEHFRSEIMGNFEVANQKIEELQSVLNEETVGLSQRVNSLIENLTVKLIDIGYISIEGVKKDIADIINQSSTLIDDSVSVFNTTLSKHAAKVHSTHDDIASELESIKNDWLKGSIDVTVQSFKNVVESQDISDPSDRVNIILNQSKIDRSHCSEKLSCLQNLIDLDIEHFSMLHFDKIRLELNRILDFFESSHVEAINSVTHLQDSIINDLNSKLLSCQEFLVEIGACSHEEVVNLVKIPGEKLIQRVSENFGQFSIDLTEVYRKLDSVSKNQIKFYLDFFHSLFTKVLGSNDKLLIFQKTLENVTFMTYFDNYSTLFELETEFDHVIQSINTCHSDLDLDSFFLDAKDLLQQMGTINQDFVEILLKEREEFSQNLAEFLEEDFSTFLTHLNFKIHEEVDPKAKKSRESSRGKHKAREEEANQPNDLIEVEGIQLIDIDESSPVYKQSDDVSDDVSFQSSGQLSKVHNIVIPDSLLNSQLLSVRKSIISWLVKRKSKTLSDWEAQNSKYSELLPVQLERFFKNLKPRFYNLELKHFEKRKEELKKIKSKVQRHCGSLRSKIPSAMSLLGQEEVKIRSKVKDFLSEIDCQSSGILEVKHLSSLNCIRSKFSTKLEQLIVDISQAKSSLVDTCGSFTENLQQMNQTFIENFYSTIGVEISDLHLSIISDETNLEVQNLKETIQSSGDQMALKFDNFSDQVKSKFEEFTKNCLEIHEKELTFLHNWNSKLTLANSRILTYNNDLNELFTGLDSRFQELCRVSSSNKESHEYLKILKLWEVISIRHYKLVTMLSLWKTEQFNYSQSKMIDCEVSLEIDPVYEVFSEDPPKILVFKNFVEDITADTIKSLTELWSNHFNAKKPLRSCIPSDSQSVQKYLIDWKNDHVDSTTSLNTELQSSVVLFTHNLTSILNTLAKSLFPRAVQQLDSSAASNFEEKLKESTSFFKITMKDQFNYICNSVRPHHSTNQNDLNQLQESESQRKSKVDAEVAEIKEFLNSFTQNFLENRCISLQNLLNYCFSLLDNTIFQSDLIQVEINPQKLVAKPKTVKQLLLEKKQSNSDWNKFFEPLKGSKEKKVRDFDIVTWNMDDFSLDFDGFERFSWTFEPIVAFNSTTHSHFFMSFYSHLFSIKDSLENHFRQFVAVFQEAFDQEADFEKEFDLIVNTLSALN